ncbi:Aste57867_8177 [Aphanomyces stellatus]|uniref:Transmembrane protein 230 n=1 Tax=Aphanomyces stellatus TaxID=120398 RepID=A0A485KJL7_9STRA|nr:hypothetical protein As57867_008146 [Aphanomyces stellatus]VFT85065.1 Aste57867_8177 [Aphanomyces stellatus]
MMSAVAPRDVLEANALTKGTKHATPTDDDDDDAVTVDIDLKDDTKTTTTHHQTLKLTPIQRFSVGSTWTQFKDAVQESQIPVKTAIAALTLLVVGTVLLVLGFVSTAEGHGWSHVFLGMIAFIPGSYATVQLYGAYRGWRGYAFHNLPSYEGA